MTQPLGQLVPIGLRVHAGVADENRMAQLSPPQALLDLGQGGSDHGVAREHPGAHRHAAAREPQAHDHLRVTIARYDMK